MRVVVQTLQTVIHVPQATISERASGSRAARLYRDSGLRGHVQSMQQVQEHLRKGNARADTTSALGNHGRQQC